MIEICKYNVEKIIAGKSEGTGVSECKCGGAGPEFREVMAMANYPGYDPADCGNVKSAADYINHVVEDPFEPASVCKTFTFATGSNMG